MKDKNACRDGDTVCSTRRRLQENRGGSRGGSGQQARIQRNRVMDKAPTFIGIDVAKHRLQVHLRPPGESFTIDYSEEEVAALVERRLLPLEPRANARDQPPQGGAQARDKYLSIW